MDTNRVSCVRAIPSPPLRKSPPEQGMVPFVELWDQPRVLWGWPGRQNRNHRIQSAWEGLKATRRQPCHGWDTATTPGCSRSPSPSLLEELWALGSCTSILWEPPPLQAGQSHLSPWVSGTLGVSLCQPRGVTVLSPCPQSSRSPALLPLFPLFPAFPDSPSPVPVAGAAPGTAPAGSIFLQALQISIFPCRGKEPGSQTAGGDKQG